MTRVAVIGGGASGIAASIVAAESGARVTLLEAGKRIGHSILVSGNGRCNFSNADVDAGAYWNAGFVEQAFLACPPQQVWDWFAGLGLRWFAESQGRLYPQANKASSVLDVLRFRLQELGVEVRCESPVGSVRPDGGGWQLAFAPGAGRPQRFDAVIVACGGGVPGGLLPEGCVMAPASPRLCSLRTDAAAVKGLDNVRAKAGLRLLRDGSAVFAERGEVQFRAYGVSGVVVFDASRFARVGDRLELDLLPDVDERELAGEVAGRLERFPHRDAGQALAGLALPAVIRAVLRQAGIRASDDVRSLAGKEVAIARAFKAFTLGVEGFETANAQVMRGGVAVGQVCPTTMEVQGRSGLFVTGEALDVDGPCGGYNLHWAWTTALLAASSLMPS